ncbi:MAG: glycerophosphodiester phosphodiesterase family protein [Thermodesulfobacteriota bacterium]
MRRLFLLVIGVLVFTGHALAADEAALPVGIIAHRGVTTTAPENSMASLQAAWQAGLHGAEIDIRTSADGVPMLLHDPTLDRTTNGTGPVKQKKWQDLQDLVLLDQQQQPTKGSIPSLNQVLTWAAKCPGFVVALDLKDAVPSTIAQLVLKHDLQKQVVLHVGGPENAAQIRVFKNISDKLQVCLNLGWWWRIEGLPAFATSASGADSLFAAEWYFPARGFQEAIEAGAQIHVYLWGPENLPARMKAAAALGAQFISSDDPLKLLPYAIERGKIPQDSK